MEGAQRSVLLTADPQQFAGHLPYSSMSLAASAFARFPYLESLFAWRNGPDRPSPMFFNRRDRLPLWMPGDLGPNRFPVVVGADPAVAGRLLNQIELDRREGRGFSVFETRLANIPYQVVTRLLYEGALHQHLQQAIGFTVNLEWVRAHYFA